MKDDKSVRLAKHRLWAKDWCYKCAKYPCYLAIDIEHDVEHGRGIQISTKVITGFDGDSAIWNCRAFKAQ